MVLLLSFVWVNEKKTALVCVDDTNLGAICQAINDHTYFGALATKPATVICYKIAIHMPGHPLLTVLLCIPRTRGIQESLNQHPIEEWALT
jgi:hypothetical protein